MIGVLFLAIFVAGGLAVVTWLLPGQRPLYRIWLGSALGVLLMMWLLRWQPRAGLTLAPMQQHCCCWHHSGAMLCMADRAPVRWEAQDTALLKRT